MNAESPFNNIDIITVSHKHMDHFNEEIHILNNSKGKIICPKQVEEILKKNPNYSKFKQNIIAITPGLFEDTTINVSDIKVMALRLEHSH